MSKDFNSAKLILVGAGPGDPELLTIKAFKAIQSADVILYDALVNLKVFDLVFGEGFDLDNELNQSKFFFVGKRKGLSEGKQDEINSLILKFLRQDKKVIRLKGGDPLVFARGIEEYKLAIENGYGCEIIPGLSSGLSLASINGIPLTLRGESDSILLETAHDFNPQKSKYWLGFINRGGTLILYMGLSNIVEISDFFKVESFAKLPVVAVENGSLGNQRIIESNIDDLVQKLIDKSFKSPVIFYIGKNISVIKPQIQSHSQAPMQYL
jgi:uroporphyrin-III C-methyltransferase